MYAVLLAGLLADAAWGGDSIGAIAVFIALFAGLLVVIAADERKRSKRFFSKRD